MTTNGPEDVAYDQAEAMQQRKLCGILAVIPLTGVVGLHKFVLGYTTAGIIMLVLTLVSFGTVSYLVALVEGIIYLCKTDREFYDTYIARQKQWF